MADPAILLTKRVHPCAKAFIEGVAFIFCVRVRDVLLSRAHTYKGHLREVRYQLHSCRCSTERCSGWETFSYNRSTVISLDGGL